MRNNIKFSRCLVAVFFIVFMIFSVSSVFSQISEHQVIAEFSSGSKDVGDALSLGFYEESGGAGPSSLTVDKQGNIYILDNMNRRVLCLDSAGKKLKSIDISDKLNRSGRDLCVDNSGIIYILDIYPKYNFEILTAIGYPEEFGGELPPMVRIYGSEGEKIAEYYIDKNELKGNPNRIYISQKGELFVGFQTEVVKLIDMKLKFYEPFKAYVAMASKLIKGVPTTGPQNKYLAFSKHKQEYKLEESEYFIFDSRIKMKNKLFSRDLIPASYLDQDQKNNVYLQVWNKNQWKDDNSKKNYMEIMKFDQDGNLIKHYEMKRNWNTSFSREYIIDQHGNIYYLRLNENLSKFSLLRIN